MPPDPYLALGVAKDATAAAIKTQYRKLVLKCHPDKIQDEAEKVVASDKFHKIQTAWEIIGDEARRARYDAQCKLQELRKDVMERSGGGSRGAPDVRTAAYKMPTESARGGDFYARGPDRYGPTPQYEERRPSYAQEGYFDVPPRAASRKYDDYEYERSAKRTPPRDEREKPRASARAAKENDRSRKEKSRRTDKDMGKDRDRKYAYPSVEIDEESDSDENERHSRQMREQDDLRRAKEQYYATQSRQREEAENGFYIDERARKMFTQGSDAKEYIERSTRGNRRAESETRRPSPVRKGSSTKDIKYKTGKGERPGLFSRATTKPKTTSRDTGKSLKSEKERKPSLDIVDEPLETRREEPRDARKPPPLNQSKSSPADIRPVDLRPADVRPSFERQRSYTMQEEQHAPIPQMRRSETMPPTPSVTAPPRELPRDARRKEKDHTRLRAEDAYMTPEVTPEPEAKKPYNYGHQYADDVEYPTPDGYKTEVREPSQPSRPRYTRSPSPMRERERTRRTSPKQQPPPMPRTTSKQYVYTEAGDSYARPPMSRENSSRPEGRLYGEVPTTRSPRQSYTFSPPPEKIVEQKRFRPEDIKAQSGFRPRMPESRSYSRSESRRQPVHAT